MTSSRRVTWQATSTTKILSALGALRLHRRSRRARSAENRGKIEVAKSLQTRNPYPFCDYTTLTPHRMIHGDVCFAYFHKV
jgi:hypothetical protein